MRGLKGEDGVRNHMHDAKQYVMVSLALSLGSLTTAIALSLSLGNGWVEFGQVWLLTMMNIFALPLLLTDLFTFPIWVWYVILLYWISKIVATERYFP